MTIDRLLCILVVIVSGNPVFEILSSGARAAVLAGFCGVLLLVMHSRRVRVTRGDVWIFGAFAVLTAAHLATFGLEVTAASGAFLVRVAVAMLAIRAVRGFDSHYVSVMYALACISFVFYVPVALGVDLAGLLGPLRIPLGGPNVRVVHVGIHNFHLPEHASRNSGMFHEPGAFAGYLLLAMLLGARDLVRPASRRRLLVLAAAVLSTLSTTGYVALAPTLIVVVLAKRLAGSGRSMVRYAVPAVVVVSAVGWLAFERLPFMKAKIEDHLQDVAARKPWARIDRIGNFLYDLDHISQRPLVGWSPRPSTRSRLDPAILETAQGQGNGLSGFTVRYGLLGLLVFLATTFRTFRRLYGNGTLAALAVWVVAILLTGEQYLQEPLFLTLMFLPRALPATAAARGRGLRPGAARRIRRRPAVAVPGIGPPLPAGVSGQRAASKPPVSGRPEPS